MARILLKQGYLEIKVSWLERALLGERPQKLPLEQIRSVDPHPRLPDMMLHWLARQELWMSGVSSYEGQLIPTTRNPTRTLAIDLTDGEGRVFVELDDESPESAAARVNRALSEYGPGELEVHTDEDAVSEPESREVLSLSLMALGGLTVAIGTVLAITDTHLNPLVLGAGAACAIAGVIARTASPSK